jgi:transaldolase
MTKFILDSGNPQEYRDTSHLAEQHNSMIWGSTTNPSLVAKQLSGKKLTLEQAFALQKELVMEILEIVPGAVSAEVYANEETTAEEMIEQGRDIGSWHERVVVKLPTTLEGFKARTVLRSENILTNNTLVFSQQQIFAICLHEKILVANDTLTAKAYPSFISPFVGRLDDTGENGMDLIENGMKIKSLFPSISLWMLEASVRSTYHIAHGMEVGTELITAPAKAYEEYFSHSAVPMDEKELKPIAYWEPSEELLAIESMEDFMTAITEDKLDITHPLTEKGIVRFAEDWKAILA